MDWSRSRFEGLSVLVNNAGMIRRAPAAETTAEDWHDVIGLNLTRRFLPRPWAQPAPDGGLGSIINVVSMNAFQGGMEVPAYTASKHGLLGITRALANEWTGHGIRVNGIAPGWMATDLTVALREDSARDEALLARMPIGRWGEPGDLAGAVVYLASDAARYVSASSIAVDGGWLAR